MQALRAALYAEWDKLPAEIKLLTSTYMLAAVAALSVTPAKPVPATIVQAQVPRRP